MKTYCLPETQDEHNKVVVTRLRWIGSFQLTLILVVLVAALLIHFKSPVLLQAPHVVSTDGATDFGDAIILSPDSAICSGQLPGSVAIEANGEHILASRIGSVNIGETRISLLQLQSIPSTPLIVTPVAAHSGDRITASLGGSAWDGILADAEKNEYLVQPSFSLGSGVGVFLKSDSTSIVGFSAEANGRTIVVPIANVLEALHSGAAKQGTGP